MILYSPFSSLTTVLTFSMSAGLAASIVTPGNTAPELSRTTPATALVPCAFAVAGTTRAHAHIAMTCRARLPRANRTRPTPCSAALSELVRQDAIMFAPFRSRRPPQALTLERCCTRRIHVMSYADRVWLDKPPGGHVYRGK